MPLSLKDPETETLARRIVFITGETITQVIKTSLMDRLEKLEHKYVDEQKLKIETMIQNFASRIPKNVNSLDHGDFFYDSSGLPK